MTFYSIDHLNYFAVDGNIHKVYIHTIGGHTEPTHTAAEEYSRYTMMKYD